MTPPTRPSPRAWESLAPWEKAAQWHDAAPHISGEVMALAKQHAEHQWQMERDAAAHKRLMDKRRWISQLLALGMGLVNVSVLSLVAWHYADTGNIAPGLATFGAGGGLTAGAYFVGRGMLTQRGTQRSQSAQEEESNQT